MENNNIQDMLNEIKVVVQTHLQDEQNQIKKTLAVLNNLPIVVELKKEIVELKKENKAFKEFYMKYKNGANIELEIIEVEKKGGDTLEKKTINNFFTPVFSNHEEEDDIITDNEDNPAENVEPIIVPQKVPTDDDDDDDDESDTDEEIDLTGVNTHGLVG